MRSVASVFVSVCPVCALTFESIDPETSFLVKISRSSSYIKVMVKVKAKVETL